MLADWELDGNRAGILNYLLLQLDLVLIESSDIGKWLFCSGPPGNTVE